MAGDENLRIGDAERDEAITLLREHMSAGRITAEEFDERMSSALTAKTKGELSALFNDLPGRGPSTMYGAPVYDASHSQTPCTTFLVDHVRHMGRSDSGIYHIPSILGWALGPHALGEPRIQQEDDQIS